MKTFDFIICESLILFIYYMEIKIDFYQKCKNLNSIKKI
jgi:hypothetical protein